jgi:hypothetical protein
MEIASLWETMNSMRLEISTQRKRLVGRTERRGSQTGLPTWGAFVFGGMFVAVGTAILLVGLRVIPVDPQGVHAPWWVLTVMGSVFALAGLAVWSMAARQWRSAKRRREAEQRHPGEPALADYGWDITGFAPSRWSRAAKALAGAGGLTLFLSIFNYWAFFAEGPWMVKGVVTLFDLILIAVWWEACLKVGRAIKFGGLRIEFARFPYRPGEPVVVRWHPADGIVQGRRGSFTLRGVEEWFEHSGSGKNRSAHLVQEEFWRATWQLDEPRLFTRGEILELRFEPPTDAPGTRISSEKAKPVFWEFEVKLDLPGLDFEEVYLVPVYGTGRLDQFNPTVPSAPLAKPRQLSVSWG